METTIIINDKYYILSVIILVVGALALVAEMLPEVSAKLIVVPALASLIGLVAYTLILTRRAC
jgi:hypothetical protein